MPSGRSAPGAGAASGVNRLRPPGPFLSARVSDGTLRVVGAYYELATGAVEWA